MGRQMTSFLIIGGIVVIGLLAVALAEYGNGWKH
jgi:hypothetical protein